MGAEPAAPVTGRIGIVGLGSMGHALASRLIDQGCDVVVHNRSSARADDLVARGAAFASSVREIWDSASVCVSMLADDAAVLATFADGDGLAGDGERALVEMSTISVAASERVAQAARAAGVDYLRAPVSGNPVVLTAGNLMVMASGERATYDRLTWLLERIGRSHHYLGDGEQARVVKLAINLVLAGITELVAEAVVLGEATAVDRAALLDVMADSAAGSPFLAYKRDALVASDYRSTFTTRLLAKDLDLMAQAVRGAGVEAPVAALVRALTGQAIGRGYGEHDLTALLPSLQISSDVQPDVPPGDPA